MKRSIHGWLLLIALAMLVVAGREARADDPPAASASAAASARAPLPDLPKLAPIAVPEPDPASTKDLDALLERLTSADERTRTAARGELGDAQPTIVPAVRQRVQKIRGTLDRDAAPKILGDARKAGRKRLEDAKKGDDEEEGDWLDFMLAMPRPKDAAWRDVVELLAMQRLLAAAGTTPAVREMIAMHSYFGDLLRIDIQRHVKRLKDRAVPALIEARQHDAKVVSRWASRMLDQMGKAIPGEAVASNDTQVLADVLRAYGRTRDVDAARVILSFANSDRVQLREAAREAIGAIGEPAGWQLKDVYLGLTGNKPPRDWSWDRLAREIFAMYDQTRMAEVSKVMADGLALAKAGKHAEAVEAFDKVLARAPLFDGRKQMVASYVARAKEIDDPEQALAMLRKALRLCQVPRSASGLATPLAPLAADPGSPDAKKLEAEIAYREGKLLIDKGTPDKFILERALELDPSHEGARAALAGLTDQAVARESSFRRYGAAAGIGVLALVGIILLARRRPSRDTKVEA